MKYSTQFFKFKEMLSRYKISSAIVAIIGFASSVIGVWQYSESIYYSREKVIKRLSEYEKYGKYLDENNELKSIQNKSDLRDVFNSYSASLSVKNGSISTGSPDFYFNNTSPESDLYIRTCSSLIVYYYNTYGPGYNPNLSEKLDSLADKIGRDKGYITHYFYLKLLAIYAYGKWDKTTYDYDKINSLYKKFIETYKSVIDFNSYDMKFHISKDGFVIIDDAQHIPSIALFFNVILSYSAELHNNIEGKKDSLINIKRITSNKNYTGLEFGIDSVFPEFTLNGLGSDLMSRIKL